MNNKFITNVETKVNAEAVEVTVSVMPFDDYRCREKVSLGLREIGMLIEEKGIKVGKCIQNPRIQNKVRSSATWIFEKPQVQKPVKSKSPSTGNSKRRKNQRKVQKNLDNSQKDVIIEE